MAGVDGDARKMAGNIVDLEITVDYTRKSAPAKVVELPFFRPPRMRA